MPIHDGNTVRFTADDFAPGSAQRAIAQGDRIGGTVAPVAAPTVAQVLAGETAYSRRYNERIENAWRDPKPLG